MLRLAKLIVNHPTFDRELSVEDETRPVTFIYWIGSFLTIVGGDAKMHERLFMETIGEKMPSILNVWSDSSRAYLARKIIDPLSQKTEITEVGYCCELVGIAVRKDWQELAKKMHADLDSISMFFFRVHSEEGPLEFSGGGDGEYPFSMTLWNCFLHAENTGVIYKMLEPVMWDKVCFFAFKFKIMILGLVPLLDPETQLHFNTCLNIVHRAAKKILIECLAMYKPKETLNGFNCRILYLLICPDSGVRHKADQLLLKATETDE